MKKHLLVVDDEQEIRDMLSRQFRFLGYSVLTAGNGREALALMENTPVEIVISDIRMPVMDGIDLLRVIHRDYPMTHVIMLTGYVTQENILSCMRHGADTCIFKPIEDMEEIKNAVARAEEALNTWMRKIHELRARKTLPGKAKQS
jgi:CheY-like chemotaxis protein